MDKDVTLDVQTVGRLGLVGGHRALTIDPELIVGSLFLHNRSLRKLLERMTELRLHEATDSHFAWLLGECLAPDGLTEPPGGVDAKSVISSLRDLTAGLRQAGCCSHWLIVVGEEVVGLCGFKHPPSLAGEAEIGYGVAESRRGRGYATRAVALMLNRGRQEKASRFIAETAVSNRASQLVLERNGFSRTGTRHDPEDGDLILWTKAVST